MTNGEMRDWLVDCIGLLRIPGVGRTRYRRLVEAFGSPERVLSASIDELEQVKGVSRANASAIKQQYNGIEARALAGKVIQLGWAALTLDHPEYPEPLRITQSAPPLLFRIGDATPSDEKMIAIVGTRKPSEKGRLFAAQLGTTLARSGITVVSGMAEGIDAAAHNGALEGGGKTIAVLGSALDVIYPATNKGLAQRIRNQGALYSEYLPGTKPDRAFFPERNRIISGLSRGVVVIEAGRKSGALITASHALEQGRELFAVPGSPQDNMSEGTNELIRKGARLTTSPEDIFDELPTLKGEVAARKFIQLPDMTDDEKMLTTLFATGPMQVDQLSRVAELPVAKLMELLLALELKGVVRELSGKRFVLAEEYA
ncbi:MAG: DNA-processing protein DprA [candidate division Zixibacteria bacterium]|nr:DNA-processing protein DprA [candidate division Zixibacteria bacterium]